MKKFILLGIACLATLVLTGCASNKNYYGSQVRNDQIQERWLSRINLDPNLWTAHADRWYYTDTPRNFNDYAAKAPTGAAITAMMVRVPDFTNIVVSGPYKIEIFGRQVHNSLFILGSNEAARHVAVELNGGTAMIHPATECKGMGCGSSQVIVRIGVNQLRNLTVNGNSFVEGKDITSCGLSVKSTAKSEVILIGNMNLQNVAVTGGGTVTVIGSYSPVTDVLDSNGNVNISGHVGLHNVVKSGNGTINVIGVDTDGLFINSEGGGVTALAGYANLRKAAVKQNSQVYLYWVNSNGIYINLHGNGKLGLAGYAKSVDLVADGSSSFQGKYLRTENMYVTTRNSAHANVSAQQKLFANASDYSSIFFFGTPNVVSRYTSSSGLIVPIFNDTCPIGAPIPRKICDVPAFKGETNYKDEVSYKGESRYRHHKRTSNSYIYH
jgi:hypothetical protein